MLINRDTIDIEKIESGDHSLYNEMGLIADKLRAIYNLFGWRHMLEDFEDADNTVEMLTMDCLRNVLEKGTRITMSTGGLTVDCSEDDEFISIDYSFNLG